MKVIAVFVATAVIGLASAQSFNWYYDTGCSDYMTTTGNPGSWCAGTPYGANSVMLTSCGDEVCNSWGFYTSGTGCTGESAAGGFTSECTNCGTQCTSYSCLDIGDSDAFTWATWGSSCGPEGK